MHIVHATVRINSVLCYGHWGIGFEERDGDLAQAQESVEGTRENLLLLLGPSGAILANTLLTAL